MIDSLTNIIVALKNPVIYSISEQLKAYKALDIKTCPQTSFFSIFYEGVQHVYLDDNTLNGRPSNVLENRKVFGGGVRVIREISSLQISKISEFFCETKNPE